MKLKTTEFKKAERQIALALKGVDQVTFHLDVSARLDGTNHPLVRTQVILWFGHTFPVKVQGGEDIAWLARECRKKAEEYLAKMYEIVTTRKNGKLTE